MTVKRILGLGTYPVALPVHGGQRRIAAFKHFYRTLGVTYEYASVYNPAFYRGAYVGPHDFPLKAPLPLSDANAAVPFIDDLLAGSQVERDPATVQHFAEVVDGLNPDALQLEQPFMWPLAKRIREAAGKKHLLVIYSSQNVEAPLKATLLKQVDVPPEARQRVCTQIETIELECVKASEFLICVSAADRDYYLRFKAPNNVIIVPNGTDRPPVSLRDESPHEIFGERPFLFVVGSPYPPNIAGFCELVARDGMFHVPPALSIAVCGGVAEGIFQSPVYQRYLAANSARTHFFPKIDDHNLWRLKAKCHGVILPILDGGGTNLKTAEALVLGKWVIATSTALRGYEKFSAVEGLIEANDSKSFRHAMRQVLVSPPLQISEQSRKLRDSLYWDRCFAESTLTDRLSRLDGISNQEPAPGDSRIQ